MLFQMESSIHILPAGACEKVASDLGLGGGFRRVLRFPPPVTTGSSRLRRIMAEKVTKHPKNPSIYNGS